MSAESNPSDWGVSYKDAGNYLFDGKLCSFSSKLLNNDTTLVIESTDEYLRTRSQFYDLDTEF